MVEGTRMGRPRRPLSSEPREKWQWPKDELRVTEHRGKIEVAILDASPTYERRGTALRISYERAAVLIRQLQTLIDQAKENGHA
jgi:hypothetical protein